MEVRGCWQVPRSVQGSPGHQTRAGTPLLVQAPPPPPPRDPAAGPAVEPGVPAPPGVLGHAKCEAPENLQVWCLDPKDIKEGGL